jgi:hypothetical protein
VASIQLLSAPTVLLLSGVLAVATRYTFHSRQVIHIVTNSGEKH